MIVDLEGEPFFAQGENRSFHVSVRSCFEMRRQEWAKITLYAPEGVELLSAAQVMLPLNNVWGASAEAEFIVNADLYAGAKLEMLVDVQLEGRHSYGVTKVVLMRRG